jgi:carbonic anhydrase
MNRRDALKAIAGFTLCPLCAKAGFAAEGAHWSYEGPTGPNKWDGLDAASKVCGLGDQQSPINIGETIAAQLPSLEIAWSKKVETIVHNGHTIQLQPAAGGTLKINDQSYKLVQFHFHHPSEHRIGGKSLPMEVHFVHGNATGALAVIGVLMTSGGMNPAFSKIAANMPRKAGPAIAADPAIDPAGLLPATRNYYNYEGSLTTPPCSQTVKWILLTEPLAVAEADIAAFAKLFPLNARPIQKINRRFVLRSG